MILIKLKNTNCDKENLFCLMVMTSSLRSPRTVSKQSNRDNEKQALFVEKSMISFLSIPHLKE